MDEAANKPRLRVAICGGGIGGLTFALALAHYPDLAIDVYEAAACFEEIGAGFAIWGRGATVLKKLGLEEKIRTITSDPGPYSKFNVRNSEIPSGGYTIGNLVLSSTWGLHRAQFLSLLVDAVAETGRAAIHFGKRCVTFSQIDTTEGGDPVTIHFKDGSSATCDVLVGCDGMRSAVRRELLQTEATDVHFKSLKFSGTVAYRTLVRPDDLAVVGGDNHPGIKAGKMYCGKDKHIVTYPVAGGRFINLIAYSSDPQRQEEWETGPWVVAAEQQEVLQLYRDFEPEVQAMLKCISKPSRWAMYEVEPLPIWYKGRVTILGDSAHGMTPFIGAGGGQVMEDAYILSRLLGSSLVTCRTVSRALQGYEHVRRPRATQVTLATRHARKMLEFQEEYAAADTDTLRSAMALTTEWLWEGKDDIEDDVKAAMTFMTGSDTHRRVSV